MPETDAHELVQTVLCKVAGCERDALSLRGRYAKLCDEHRAHAMARVAAAPLAVPASGTFVERLKGLTDLARRVDQAYARAARARVEVEPRIRKAKDAKSDADKLAADFRNALRAMATE